VASGTAIAREARDRLAAGQAPKSRVRELADGRLETITSALVGAAAMAGDEFAIGLIAEAGTYIGAMVASLQHALNPAIVVFGGGVSMLGDLLLDPIRDAIQRHALSDAYWRECPIVLSALGDDAGLIGAAALAMEEVRYAAGSVPLSSG
jgi:glucokinase